MLMASDVQEMWGTGYREVRGGVVRECIQGVPATGCCSRNQTDLPTQVERVVACDAFVRSQSQRHLPVSYRTWLEVSMMRIATAPPLRIFKAKNAYIPLGGVTSNLVGESLGLTVVGERPRVDVATRPLLEPIQHYRVESVCKVYEYGTFRLTSMAVCPGHYVCDHVRCPFVNPAPTHIFGKIPTICIALKFYGGNFAAMLMQKRFYWIAYHTPYKTMVCLRNLYLVDILPSFHHAFLDHCKRPTFF